MEANAMRFSYNAIALSKKKKTKTHPQFSGFLITILPVSPLRCRGRKGKQLLLLRTFQ